MPRAPRRRRATVAPTERHVGRQRQANTTAPPANSPELSDQMIETISTRITERVTEKVLSAVTEKMDTVPIFDVNDQGNSLPNNVISNDDNNDDNIALREQSVSNDLGCNVSNKIKLKIANGEYVDLASLITKPSDTDDQVKQLSFSENKIIVTPKTSETKIFDVQQWTDAFLIFASIYTTAHPSAIPGIFKYMHTVRLGAKRAGGLGWKSYDIQFRLKKEKNPALSWSVVDQELWLLHMYGTNLLQYKKTPSSPASPSAHILKCYDYNYIGACTRPKCQYAHICLKCSRPHPSSRCRVRYNNSYSRFGQNTATGASKQQTSTESERADKKPGRQQRR